MSPTLSHLPVHPSSVPLQPRRLMIGLLHAQSTVEENRRIDLGALSSRGGASCETMNRRITRPANSMAAINRGRYRDALNTSTLSLSLLLQALRTRTTACCASRGHQSSILVGEGCSSDYVAAGVCLVGPHPAGR